MEELVNKRKFFKTAMGFIAFFLMLFIGINNGYSFTYAEFNFEEFIKEHPNYWGTSTCNESGCEDKIIRSQEKYYKRLYELLAKYDKKGLHINDKIIVATSFFGFDPSEFNDNSGAYNINENDNNDEKTAEYYANETDTLELLISTMVGIERVCTGYNKAEVSNNDGNESTYYCKNGILTSFMGINYCTSVIDIEYVNFWDRLQRNNTSLFWGFSFSDTTSDCESKAKENGFEFSKISYSKEKVVEEKYWEFLTNGTYFDNKEHLQSYFRSVLNKTGKKKVSDLTEKEYIAFDEEIKRGRKKIVSSIQDIVNTYMKNNPDTSYTEASDYDFYWPIGSRETTTKNGVVLADGLPETTYITSPYGIRVHPITNEVRKHNGIDIGDGSLGNTNIIASKSGNIVKVVTGCTSGDNKDSSCGGGYGNYIMILHNDGIYTLYAHLYENSVKVREGDYVIQGQVIANMGSSGSSTGPHLHFEVRTGASSENVVNPLDYVSADNPRPQGSSLSIISGSTSKESVCLSLKNSGFNEKSVAAIMVNIQAESGFDPNVIGDNGTSYGLCQWHDSRWDSLRSKFPDSWQTIGGQLEYLNYELQTYFTSLYNELKAGTKTANAMANDYCVVFEIPYDTVNTCRDRADTWTSSILSYVQNSCKEN